MNPKKILFLLKKGYNYGDNYVVTSRSGLNNSARIAAEELEKYFKVKTNLEVCQDANQIDKFLTQYRPDIAIIEALWVTPAKFIELIKIHPTVKFFVRIHSKVSFLANEGIAIEWIKAYANIPNVEVAYNSVETANEFYGMGYDGAYLPNLYESRPKEWYKNSLKDDIIFLAKKNYITYDDLMLGGTTINVACLGAIRPLKNQLFQAVCAINFAEKVGATLHFHINANRVEQKGEPTLKNLRALFEGSDHQLIEHNWQTHENFLSLVAKMDVGMQLSFTETFNIVAADFVSRHVPIICSSGIGWIGSPSIVKELTLPAVLEKLKLAFYFRRYFIKSAGRNLQNFNERAREYWQIYLNLKTKK